MKYEIANKSPEALWIDADLLTDRIDNSYYRLEFIESDLNNRNLPKTILKSILKSPITDFGSFSLTKEIAYVIEGIPYIRSSDFKEFFIDEESIYFITEKVNEILYKSEVFEGDILITKMGSDMGKAAYISKLPFGAGKCNSNATIAKVRVKDEFDKHYIVAYLNSKYAVNNVWRNAVGSVQPRVNLSDIENYIIATPSPEIQKYIGDKVRKAEELREEAKRSKQDAEDKFCNYINEESLLILLKQNERHKYNWMNDIDVDNNRLDAEYNQSKYTVLNNYFSHNGFILEKINTFVDEKIVSGSTPKGGNYLQNGIPFVRATNLTDYTINDDLVYISNEESKKLKSSEIKEGDIVYSIAGSVGSVSIVPEYIKKANINQALVRLRLKDINYYYFIFITNSSIGKFLSSRIANGAVQLNLNREEVGNIAIPILDNDSQEYIGAKIKSYIELLRESKQQIQDAKRDIEDLIEGNFDISKINEKN